MNRNLKDVPSLIHGWQVAGLAVTVGLALILLLGRTVFFAPTWLPAVTFLEMEVWPWLFLAGLPLALAGFTASWLHGSRTAALMGFVLAAIVLIGFFSLGPIDVLIFRHL